MTAPVRRVVLFAREPVAGRVKSRLGREIGDANAAALYAAFLQDLAVALPDPARWDSLLAYAELDPGAFLVGTFRAPWDLLPQGEGSLGDRLARAVQRARLEGRRDVVVAGSDAPTLSREDLLAAFDLLEDDADIVFAPAPDGGYTVVGLRGHVDPSVIFAGVRWSSEHALADSRRAAEARSYKVRLLPSIPDVDELRDLRTLASALASDPGLAPATRRALAALSAEEGP